MKLVAKKWGNGVAFRPPREDASYGRIEPGTAYEIEIRRVRPTKEWKPYTFRTDDPNLSTNYKALLERAFEEKWGKRRVSLSS